MLFDDSSWLFLFVVALLVVVAVLFVIGVALLFFLVPTWEAQHQTIQQRIRTRAPIPLLRLQRLSSPLVSRDAEDKETESHRSDSYRVGFARVETRLGARLLDAASSMCRVDGADTGGGGIQETKNVWGRSLEESPVALTVVIPAFNEADRIEVMLEEVWKEIQTWPRDRRVHVCIVDDGSRDETLDVIQEYFLRLVEHEGELVEERLIVEIALVRPNAGKGNAVQTGALLALGRYILMADADGATKFSDVHMLVESVGGCLSSRRPFGEDDGWLRSSIAVGSRAHLEKDSVAKRSWIRNFLMHGFHLLVMLLGGISDIRDTQCGFKLFTRPAARSLFPSQHVQRWCFDIELLRIAKWNNFAISEIPVRWTEIPGSKLSIASASITMALDMLRIRIAWALGAWAEYVED